MTIWHPHLKDNNQPRYIAIADAIAEAIQESVLTTGDKLPTQRWLADELGVTVGTITRGYAEAERRGLVYAKVGSGTYIAPREKKTTREFEVDKQRERDRYDFTLNHPSTGHVQPGFSDVLQEVAKDIHRLDLLTYQPEQGQPRHRAWASNWLRTQHVHCSAEDVTITCGGQHSIMLALMACTRPGDTIIAEGLTYPGLNAIANQLNIKVLGLSMDRHGVVPSHLEELCKQHRVRAVYLTPTNQNPTNASMDTARREEIVTLADRYNAWIIEDEVSSTVLKNPPKPLAALAPERTLYITSHSKSVSAGLRVGYLVAPPLLQERISSAIRAHCWFTPPLNVEACQRWIDRPEANLWMQHYRDDLAERNQIAMQRLAPFQFYSNPHSLHVWLHLPEPWRAAEFQRQLADKKVDLLTAESFAVGRFPAPQAVRICTCSPATKTELSAGLEIITATLQDEREINLRVI